MGLGPLKARRLLECGDTAALGRRQHLLHAANAEAAIPQRLT
ncbi:hypothetical protein [Streptomyces sp. NPDC055105]